MPHPERLLNRKYIALFIINLIVSISFSMASTSISLYVTRTGAVASVVGTVVGSLSIASLCMRPFTGIISDRTERKRLLMISLGLIAVALTGCSCTSSVPVLIFFRILHGISFSIATTVTLVLAGESVPERCMTQGMAYFALGQTFATAVAPTVGLWLGNRFGFAVTFRIAAGFLLLAVLLTFILVDRSKSERQAGGPGLHLRFSDFFAVQAIPFCILSAIAAGATGLENGFVALFGEQLGLGNVGWYFTIAAVALLVARLFGGSLTDRHERVMIPLGFAFMMLAFLSLGMLTRSAALKMVGVSFGISAALKSLGLGIVQPALQAASLKSVPRDKKGAASSTYYLGTDIGQAVAPMLGGIVVEKSGMFSMFSLYAIPLLIAVGMCLVCWRNKGGKTKDEEAA